jgi:hypothetical protein
MKHEHDKDYLEFLTSREDVPTHLDTPMKKEIGISFQGRKILAKFFIFQIVGGLFSLYFCPQWGIGKESAMWHHHFMQVSELTCTITCSTFFLCCSIFFSAMALKGEEWWWLYRRRLLITMLFPAVFWGVLMFTRLTMPMFYVESPTHNFAIWFAVGAMAQFIWVMARAQVYRLTSSSLKI